MAQELALADLARRVGEALGPLLAGVLERTAGRTDGGSDIAYNAEFTVIRELGGGPGRDVVVTLPERFATRYAADRLRPHGASPMVR